MKIWQTWAIGLLGLLIGLHGVPAHGQDLATGLEGYWSFDNFEFGAATAEDESGNGRDAEVLAGLPVPTVGKIGNGVFFDGSSDFLVPWEGVQGNNPRTIVLWVRSTDIGDGMVGWGASANNEKWHFRINNDGNQPPGGASVGSLRTEFQGSQTIGTKNVDDGQWHLVASVFEGNYPEDVRHFVDGEPDPNIWVGTAPGEFEINTNTTSEMENVTIGSRQQGGSFDRITGVLDEVRIYSRALNADEIKALYDQGATLAQTFATRSFSRSVVEPQGSVDVTLEISQGTDGTLTETVPQGWTPSSPSNNGTIDGNTITWNLTPNVTAVQYTATMDSEDAENNFLGNLDGLFTAGTIGITQLQSGAGDFASQADIGDIQAPGSADFNGSIYTVEGGGADIWSTADAMHFLFSQFEGPFRLAVSNTLIFPDESSSDWIKGGLMVRNNLTPGSSNAFIHMDGQEDNALSIRWQQRPEQEEITTAGSFFADQFGEMIIERQGRFVFTSSVDFNTGELVQLGEHFLGDLQDPVFGGLAITSHSVGNLSSVEAEPGIPDLNLDLIEQLPFSADRVIDSEFLIDVDFDTNVVLPTVLNFGGSTNVSVQVFSRNAQDLDLTEAIPENFTISGIETTAGSASTNADGDLVWTISGHQGVGELTYQLTAPSESAQPLIRADITGTANNNEIVGNSQFITRGFVSEAVLSQQDIESGLEAFWTFDDFDGTTAADASGNGRDAFAVEGEPTATDDAWKGQAIEFDGSSNLQTDWTGITENNPRTISVWVKTDLSSDNVMIEWGTNSEGEKWTIRVNSSGGNGKQWAFRTEFAGGNQTVATTPINDGEWHHVVSVFEGDHPQDVVHYVDGLFEPNTWTRKPDTQINTPPSNNVTLGSTPASTRFFQGIMDEVRIYSRALSAAEVQALFFAEGGQQPTSVKDFMLY